MYLKHYNLKTNPFGISPEKYNIDPLTETETDH
jgi:hypothetical protein